MLRLLLSVPDQLRRPEPLHRNKIVQTTFLMDMAQRAFLQISQMIGI